MTQPSQEESLPDQDNNLQKAQLEEQLREALAAENFLETATGKIWTKIATLEITRLTREVTSDKYRKDPVGYNIAISDLQAYQNILKRMQVAAAPARKAKIQERLDQYGS